GWANNPWMTSSDGSSTDHCVRRHAGAVSDDDQPGSDDDLDADESATVKPWEDLGEFIREQRRQTRLSLRKLAEMADVSNPYLSQIERGLRKPSADILQQIARALSISAESP